MNPWHDIRCTEHGTLQCAHEEEVWEVTRCTRSYPQLRTPTRVLNVQIPWGTIGRALAYLGGVTCAANSTGLLHRLPARDQRALACIWGWDCVRQFPQSYPPHWMRYTQVTDYSLPALLTPCVIERANGWPMRILYQEHVWTLCYSPDGADGQLVHMTTGKEGDWPYTFASFTDLVRGLAALHGGPLAELDDDFIRALECEA